MQNIAKMGVFFGIIFVKLKYYNFTFMRRRTAHYETEE